MGKQYRVRCKELDEQARGVVTFNNKKFAVPYLLPGELGLMELVYKKEETGARLCEVLEKSAMRTKPECPHFFSCGGCQLSHMKKEAQEAWKQELVQKLLWKFGTCEPLLTMEDASHYRNKIYATFSYDRKKKSIVSGIYEEETHRIVPVEKCLIQNVRAEEILRTIRQLMKETGTMPYEEDRQSGCLRHVYLRIGQADGQIMVVLVTGSRQFPAKERFAEELVKRHKDIATIIWNVNTKRTSMVLGDKEVVLYGRGYIEETLCGCVFRISSKSFFQVNPVQTERLYQKAMEFAALTGTETVFDAYCGTGTIGLIAAGEAKSVTGVELNAEAVRDAQSNKARNKIENADFFCADAGAFLEQEAKRGTRYDVLFMDPPRSGSSETFLRSAIKAAFSRIVYISCNPVTLKRDLEFLTRNGYEVKRIQPVDMFPETRHVETVVLLSQLRQKPDDYIDVGVDVAELEGTSAEVKATYEKIKAYVAEHNDGMKVSNLYIAQVKKKCGLELAENFNLPKSENARQPKCPKDKEKAIVEALKAFKMI